VLISTVSGREEFVLACCSLKTRKVPALAKAIKATAIIAVLAPMLAR
jgi:hypothetical protein